MRDWELYDVVAVPLQRQSLLPDGADPDVSGTLRGLLRDLRAETEAFAEEYPDGLVLEDFEADQAERMADLGYLGDDEPAPKRELDEALGDEQP